MEAVAEQIRNYLNSDLGLDLANIGNDTPLFTSGLIDSYALIELLVYLESAMGVGIDIAELDIEQIDTIKDLSILASSSK